MGDLLQAILRLLIFWLGFVNVRLTPANYVCASNISRTNGQKNKMRPVRVEDNIGNVFH